MKKILFLAVLLFVLSNCKSGIKKVEDATSEEDIELSDLDTIAVIEPTSNPKADKDLLDPKQGVIVVFNEKMTETEDLISEKGLNVERILFNENSLKVGLIKVPADKKDYWLNQLIESGDFKDVKIFSEKNLEKLIKEQKAKAKK